MKKNNTDMQEIVIRQMFWKLYPMQFLTRIMPHLSNVISGLLIGNFLPQIAMTAVGFTYPIQIIISAFSYSVVYGGNILCNRALGRCDAEDMNRIFSVSMTLLFCFGALLSFLGLAFATQIASLLGASGEALTLTATYIHGLAIGYIPMLLVSGLMIFFPIANDAQYGMYSSVVLVASNLLFGYLNAKVFHGGILGMGLSSSLGQYVALTFLLIRFHFNKSLLRFRLHGNVLQTVKDIFHLGIPSAVQQMATAIANIAIVALIPKLGGNNAVAAYGIYSSIYPLFNDTGASMKATGTAILSIYIDLKDVDAQKKAPRDSIKFNTIVTLFTSFLMIVIASPFSRLLGAEGEVLSIAVRLLWVYAAYIIVLLPERLFASAHESFGHTKLKNIDNLLTCCILPIVFAYGLGYLVGINGVWFCWMISDFLSLFTFYFYARKVRETPPKSLWDICLTESTANYGERMKLSIHTMEEVIHVSQNVIAFCKGNGIDAKRSYLCGLCLEELSGNIVAHGFSKSKRKNDSIDIFLRVLDGEILVRLCDNAPNFDPMRRLGAEDTSDPMKNFGIRMVRRVAKTMEYKPTYGMNVISITL